MFIYRPKKAAIFKAVHSPYPLKKAANLKRLWFIIFLLVAVFWIVSTLEPSLRIISTTRSAGLVFLSFFVFLFFWYLDIFFRYKVEKPKLPFSLKEAASKIEDINFAEYLNHEAAEILYKAENSKGKSSTEILYHLVKQADFSQFIFSRMLIDKNDLLQAINSIKDKKREKEITDSFKSTITIGLSEAAKRGGERVRAEDLMVALSSTDPFFEKVLIKKDIKEREVRSLARWHIRIKKSTEDRRKFWRYENLIRMGTIGREWAAGNIYLLSKFSTDWTEAISRLGFRKTIGHKDTIEEVERVLSGDGKNDVILVGNPGTGRSSIIDEITRRSFLGFSLPGVNYKRVHKLNLHSLVARTEGKEATEKALDKIFREAAKAGNIILVVEDFHEFISSGDKAGVIDISGVVDSYLNHPDFKLIGVTNYRDYRGTVEKNQGISTQMIKIEVGETTPEESLKLCEMMTGGLERKYKVFISYQGIKAAVELTEKYLPSKPLPEKAIEILEETVISVSQKKKKVLEKEDVAEVLSRKAEVPVGTAAEEERKILLNMEEEIHKRIINQKTAVSEISKSLRRSRAEIDTRTGLIGSFLFLGPTGVGKTETAKAIADIYFGSAEKMIRIDMSEYQNISDISRLIGSEERGGVLTERVIEDPFSLILLDELEKAHKDILNLFLQILDEGHVTDGSGRKVIFKNCMIIATSNAGYKIIMDSVKEGVDLKKAKEKIMEYVFKKGIFRPEFVNRFDGTVLFEPLSKEHLVEIAGLQLEKMKKNLKEKHIELNITEEVKRKIVEESYDPVFGAREMQRFIQNKIGDRFASALLAEDLSPGDKVKINPEGLFLEKIN